MQAPVQPERATNMTAVKIPHHGEISATAFLRLVTFDDFWLLHQIHQRHAARNAVAVISPWGIFTAVMLSARSAEPPLHIVFGSLTVYFLLAYGDFPDASASFRHFTCYEGIVCGHFRESTRGWRKS